MTANFNFVNGHFSAWGGTIGTQNNLVLRIRDLYLNLFVNGLGFWWVDTGFMRIALSLIIAFVSTIFLYSLIYRFTGRKCERNNVYFMFVCILPYLIWIFLGQNLSKPRHALPLIPFSLILISVGIMRLNLRLPAKAIIILILFTGFCTISTHLIIKNKRSLPTQLQLINYVKDNFNINSTRIYCWESKRLFEYYAPAWDTRRVKDADDIEKDMQSSLVIPEFVLCTSMIEGIENHNLNLNFLKKFEQERYVNNLYNRLVLYRLENRF